MLPTMKTILFLDVNGVLDCLRCGHGADCGHFQRLRRIVDALECDIVLTSSVRTHRESCRRLREQFAEYRIPGWIGATPDLCGARWTEIMKWVEQHLREETRLVILDDGDDDRPRPLPLLSDQPRQRSRRRHRRRRHRAGARPPRVRLSRTRGGQPARSRRQPRHVHPTLLQHGAEIPVGIL